MKKILIIIGAGGHAKSCIDVIESQKYYIFGILDNSKKKTFMGYKILGNDSKLKLYRKIKT